MNTLNKTESLAKTSKSLMLAEPYYGYFLIMLNKMWRKDLPTAGVSKNGINYQLAINEEFWMSLSECAPETKPASNDEAAR